MSKQKDKSRKRHATKTGRRHQVDVLTEEEVRREGMDALAGISSETQGGDYLRFDDGLDDLEWFNPDDDDLNEQMFEDADAALRKEILVDWGEPSLRTLCEEMIAERSLGDEDASEAA